MSDTLPELSLADFRTRLGPALGGDAVLPSRVVARAHAHYEQLRRWNAVHGLVGRNEGPEIVERHYAEALAARSLFDGRTQVLDIGSGGGFPGLLLATLDQEVTLVESRGKKAAFLRTAASQMGVEVTVLAERLDVPLPASLPEHVDHITLRAVRLEPRVWQALAARYDRARALVWAGPTAPALPAPWAPVTDIALPSGGGRRIAVYRVASNRDGI